MNNKFTQYIIGLLIGLCVLLFASSSYANSLISDPFVHQHIDKHTFEPGGQNHLFGSARGAITDRKGDIYIIPTTSIATGSVRIDQALVAGRYAYHARFDGHKHHEHAPFINSSSKQKTVQAGIQGIDFTSLSMQFSGTKMHPADAYDGAQGSGYPAPTGARDEYSYVVSGNVIGARINLNDNRSATERLKERKNALDNAKADLTDAFEQGLTHNPNLNRIGNMANTSTALAKGVGAAVGVPFEWAGASDVADGALLVKDLALLEAMRGLSHNNKLSTAHSLQSVQNLQSQYGQWKAKHPNTAMTVDAAMSTAETLLKKSGGKVEAKGGNYIKDEVGSYTNHHKSGKTYSGKGSRYRSQVSGAREASINNDPHIATDFTPAKSHRDAFKDESLRLDNNGGVSSDTNYNRIESPGKKYRFEDGDLK